MPGPTPRSGEHGSMDTIRSGNFRAFVAAFLLGLILLGGINAVDAYVDLRLPRVEQRHGGD